MSTLTPAGERLVTAASELFYRRGIRAVGVDLIAEHAGTTKKTLYDRFGSKDALVALYLNRRLEQWQTLVLDHLEQHPAVGAERILSVYDALADWMQESRRGCGFINAYAEIGGTDHPGVAIVGAEKTWVRELYVRLCVEEGFDPAVGVQLHLLHEGAIVALTAGGQPDSITQARTAAAALLQSHSSR